MSWSSRQVVILVGAVVLAAAVLVWALNTRSQPEANQPQPSIKTTETAGSAKTSKSSTPTTPPKKATVQPIAEQPALDSVVELGEAATAQIIKIEKVSSQGELPGELSAPALRFTIEVTAGEAKLNLATVVVNAYYGKAQTPAVTVGEPGGRPFAGTLAKRETATGVYVFNIPTKERGDVRVEFSWSPKEKPVTLAGKVR